MALPGRPSPLPGADSVPGAVNCCQVVPDRRATPELRLATQSSPAVCTAALVRVSAGRPSPFPGADSVLEALSCDQALPTFFKSPLAKGTQVVVPSTATSFASPESPSPLSTTKASPKRGARSCVSELPRLRTCAEFPWM